MPTALLVLIGLAANLYVLALLLLTLLSARAKQDVDDMVGQALKYMD
jgi:hypothetical protein